jgi:hypothetical protein
MSLSKIPGKDIYATSNSGKERISFQNPSEDCNSEILTTKGSGFAEGAGSLVRNCTTA